MEIRLLRADEIECRPAMVSEKGLSLLLYKDARADMKILDEVFGTMGWQREHILIGENLYCVLKIWDSENRQWITKSDVGTKSYTEEEKGAASDSFKRACVSAGIGRELYTAPFIWISKLTNLVNKNGKYSTTDKFKVSEIDYDDNREIAMLTIVNQNNEVVYRFNSCKSGKILDETKLVSEFRMEVERTGIPVQTILNRFNISSLDEMDTQTYEKALTALKKTKSKVA